MAIHKYMDLSTAHITEEDDKLIQDDLNNNYGILCGAAYEGGYWLYVPPRGVDRYLFEVGEDHFSESFLACLRKAQKADCTYLRLDCDAEICEDLAKHDW